MPIDRPAALLHEPHPVQVSRTPPPLSTACGSARSFRSYAAISLGGDSLGWPWRRSPAPNKRRVDTDQQVSSRKDSG